MFKWGMSLGGLLLSSRSTFFNAENFKNMTIKLCKWNETLLGV